MICGIWGCALFETCEMKKGASLLAMENQQNDALIFGKLFEGRSAAVFGKPGGFKKGTAYLFCERG